MTPDGDDDRRRQEFAAFVARHARELDRLAYLLLGDGHAAEDLAADALLAAWQHWDRVSAADHPLAYVRRILVNRATERFRDRSRESVLLGRLKLGTMAGTDDPDGAAALDVRAALLRLPPGRRACLVLRHGFGLSEEEVARTLGVAVGTVKSQTSKALAQFRREVSGPEPQADPPADPQADPLVEPPAGPAVARRDLSGGPVARIRRASGHAG